MICLPVQYPVYAPAMFWFGIKIAGVGISYMSMCVIISMTSSRWKNTFDLDSRWMPSSPSCTRPISGDSLCVLMANLLIIISSCSSAFASSPCGTWMFSSSPSKSALSGVVTDTLIRTVLNGSILTRRPNIEYLWSDGWRLIATRSSSISCLCTISPGVSCIVLPISTMLYRVPSWRSMELAFSFTISFSSHLMFHRVHRSGNVRFSAIDFGRPIWSTLRLASQLATVLAVKLHRLPCILSRIRPRFPDIRSRMDLTPSLNPLVSGCVADAFRPALVSIKNLSMAICRVCMMFFLICAGLRFCMASSHSLFFRSMLL